LAEHLVADREKKPQHTEWHIYTFQGPTYWLKWNTCSCTL